METLNTQEMLYLLALVNGKTPPNNEIVKKNIIYKLTTQINASNWYGDSYGK